MSWRPRWKAVRSKCLTGQRVLAKELAAYGAGVHPTAVNCACGISHKCSSATWRRHSCRRLPSTPCHSREQVSRRVSTRQARVPNAAYFYHRRSSAFVVGQAILPAAAFQAAFPVRERAFVGQRPAESRLQPGLAAPQIRRDGLQDQKVCGIRHECLRHIGCLECEKCGLMRLRDQRTIDILL
jgi:hypothetical protein